jgi:acyl carrier protein
MSFLGWFVTSVAALASESRYCYHELPSPLSPGVVKEKKPGEAGESTRGVERTVGNLPPEVVLGTQLSPMELELAQLIAAATNLDIVPEQIDPTAPIFGEGLGLDSIDMLEVALAISQRYGFSLRSDDPETRTVFASLRNLAAHIEKNRTK